MSTSRTDQVHDAGEGAGSLLLLGLLAPLSGLGAGVIGALFRWVLARANQFRDVLIAYFGHSGVGGIVLVTEMTSDATLLLPMIVACSAAMLVPALFGNSSILDALGARALARRDRQARVMPGQGPRTMNQTPGADDGKR